MPRRRTVPGRKSDVNDAPWIADLLAHGLIHSSMVPPGPIQELHDLTRTRKQLMREVVQHKQSIQKVLEDANVTWASMVSDMVGQSGRRILKALIAGQTDAHQPAALSSEQLAASRETLATALHGKVTAHHRFLLKQCLQMIEQLEQTVNEFEAQIEAALAPFLHRGRTPDDDSRSPRHGSVRDHREDRGGGVRNFRVF
jgi:hypothetical protein